MGGEFEIEGHEVTGERMMEIAVHDLKTGEALFHFEGHEHDDGSTCGTESGRCYSLSATTVDGVEHLLLFTPAQAAEIAGSIIHFVKGETA